MKEIYIVTGASGFLGNNIVRLLQEHPDREIRALVMPGDPAPALEGMNCRIFSGDITRPDSLRELFLVPMDAQVYVIHCAAIVSIRSGYDPKIYNVNVTGAQNVMQKALEIGAKMVYINSVHSIPEKQNHKLLTEIEDFDMEQVQGQYAKTKAEMAKCFLEAVREKGLNGCIVQPSGMIGPYDFGRTHLTQLIRDLSTGRLTACVRGGYDFVDVRDVAKGAILACRQGQAGQCYILSGRYAQIQELLDLASQALGRKKIRTVLPMWFARATAPMSELYYRILRQPPLYTRYSLYTLRTNANFSNRKARQELGYTTRDLGETIKDTVWWMKKRLQTI